MKKYNIHFIDVVLGLSYIGAIIYILSKVFLRQANMVLMIFTFFGLIIGSLLKVQLFLESKDKVLTIFRIILSIMIVSTVFFI